MARKKVVYRPFPQYPFPRIKAFRYRVSPARQFVVHAFARRDSSTFWSYAFTGYWVLRYLRRMLVKEPVLVAREVLKPGQSVSLTSIAPLTRRQRRAVRAGGS